MVDLYDRWGRKIEFPKKPEERVIASVGIRDRLGDMPVGGLTPSRLAAALRAADEGYLFEQALLFEAFEERDPHIQSCLGTRKNAVARLQWQMQPASDDAADVRLAEQVTEMLGRIRAVMRRARASVTKKTSPGGRRTRPGKLLRTRMCKLWPRPYWTRAAPALRALPEVRP